MDSAQQDAALRGLIERIAVELGLTGATVELHSDDESVVATLHGESLGLFIGRHGQTIDAVQHLAQRILLASEDAPRRRVVVDAEGYRARRQEALERQADHAAEQAERYGRAVALDAMSASERKLVHEYLRERGGVRTHSEGDPPDRHLVVSPE
jgi:spoIIIJ-associated protein